MKLINDLNCHPTLSKALILLNQMQEARSAGAEERIRTRKRRSSADEQTERPQKILRGKTEQPIALEESSRLVGKTKTSGQLPSPPSINPQPAPVLDRPLAEGHQSTDQKRPHSFGNEPRKRKRSRQHDDADHGGVLSPIDNWLLTLPNTPEFDDMSAPPSKRSRPTDVPLQRSSLSSEISKTTISETTISRSAKYSAYKNVNYPIVLETKDSFMWPSEAGLVEEDLELCQRLLHDDQAVPTDTLFDEERFKRFCSLLQGRSEARVYLDLHSLLVPSSENLYIRGLEELGDLIQGYNDSWVKAIPFYGPRPQPDHTVGFKWSAFSKEQRRKLGIDPMEKSLYTAREDIYFPFLTSEVKCGKQALDLADRPNAHSMTIVMRGIIDLYRKVGRAADVHRRVLGFSISHDDNVVRIYAHYPEVQGDKTAYYRYEIKQFSFTGENGRERWTAYRFTMNVYLKFASPYLTRIKSAIDQLTDPALEPTEPNLGVEQGSTLNSQEGGLSVAESQESDFKKPWKVGGLHAELRTMIQNLQTQLDQQRREAQQQSEQQRKDAQQQLEQQRKESQQQLEQQRNESQQQLEQQRKDSEQQRKDLMQMLSRQSEQLSQLLKR